MQAYSHLCVRCFHSDLSAFQCLCLVWPQCVHRHPPPTHPQPTHPPTNTRRISLPFHPSLHHFTQHHQGLASWCLHCKSGLTKRRWLDPTHIQKHLIYLFISLSCMASRCIISDQGDMPTFKCYSLHLQVILSTNKFKQERINEILRGGCAHNRLLTSTERPLSWFSTLCTDILF